MPGRAKGKRFVIRGKERLDVGLQEDEFLLQAVFYCMGAGPNPDCRAPMLAPRRRQNLITPSGHANRSAQIPPAGRPCWRCPAGKALSLRRQSLIPPPGHANRPSQIPPGSRPCCRCPLRVGGGSDILHLRRVNLNSCKWRTEYETDSSNGPRRNFGGVCDSGFCSCRGGIGN